MLLITGDIFYQFLPYLRLDGYWALADLMGIPDPLSQISPFLRSSMPMPASTDGNRLPRLRRWAKIGFIIYISLALPILALLFGLIVMNFPHAITFAWSALQSQLSALAMLWQTGTLVEIGAVAMQAALLALSLLGAIYVLYSIGRPLFTALWNWGKRSLARAAMSVLAAAAIAALLALLWIPQFTFAGRTMPDGVEQFDVPERRHVDSPVIYPQTPPVGGNHAPIWQNCGFYAEAIGSVYAVHSMEHGAVWITYLPELAPNEVEQLRQLAHRESYVIASPYPDLPAPVVASAWGYQLRLDSADDPRLEQFVRTFELGPQAPERQGPCTGGVGKPLP